MNRCREIPGVLGLVLAVAVLSSCTTVSLHLNDADRAAIVQRAEETFAEALLLKPRVSLADELPAVRLAPLLLLEAVDTNAAAAFPGMPKVFVREASGAWNGRRHAQFDYTWRFAFLPTATPDAGRWQGVRITLNAAGEPGVWEILGDLATVPVTRFFVGRSVEAAAQREFGSPLPGRRYAVERAVAETPDVVVVRVIEDGPMPMGPIVHLAAGAGEVTALVCRCMPPQVQALTGQGEYELVLEASELADSGQARFSGPTQLRRCLRLPMNF